jgi:hypothetical protein
VTQFDAGGLEAFQDSLHAFTPARVSTRWMTFQILLSHSDLDHELESCELSLPIAPPRSADEVIVQPGDGVRDLFQRFESHSSERAGQPFIRPIAYPSVRAKAFVQVRL